MYERVVKDVGGPSGAPAAPAPAARGASPVRHRAAAAPAPPSPRRSRLAGAERTRIVASAASGILGRNSPSPPASRIQRATAVPAIRVTSGGDAVIRRRVPAWADIAPLMAGPDLPAQQVGLARAIKRTYEDLDAGQKADVDAKITELKTAEDYSADRLLEIWTRVLNTVKTGAGEFPATYLGARRFVAPTGEAKAKLTATVTQAARGLRLVAAGTAGVKELQDIFGDDKQFGWPVAQARFDEAAAWLEKLEKADKIGANLSGEPEQMGYLGKTTFHEEIHLNKTAWTQLSGSGWHELFIALVHESFHAAHSDVHDAGGYIADPASFRKRAADVKYRNASHYEEVFRRLANIKPVGGVFKPGSDDDDEDEDALDIVGRGRMDAMDRLRVAHQVAVSAHKWLVITQDRQQRRVEPDKVVELTPRLLRLSRAEAWTLHARQRRPTDPLPPVTMIDLVLAEGVAKRLIKSQQWVLDNAPKDVRGWYAADPWRTRLADLQDKVAGWIYGAALQAVGPITASLDDDWAMLAELKAVHDELRPAQ